MRITQPTVWVRPSFLLLSGLALAGLSLSFSPLHAQEAAATGASPAPPALPAAIRPNPAGAPPVRLTLTDALNLALEENPGVGAVEDRIATARARARGVAGRTDPQLSATGTLIRQGPISTVTFPGQNGQPPQSIRLGTPTSKTVSINAVKPFDLSGEVGVARDIAQRGITSAELDLARAQNDLLLSVYNAYYGTLRADQFVNVAEEAVAAAQEQLRVAEVSYREGALARFDVTRAAVQVENLRQDLVTAQKNSSLARAQLLNALGISPTTPIEIVPVELPAPAVVPSAIIPVNGGSPLPPAGSEAPATVPPGDAGTEEAAPALPPERSGGTDPKTVERAESAPPSDPPAQDLPGTVTPSPEPPNVEAEVAVVSDLPLDLAPALDAAYALRPEVLNAANAVRIAERNVDLARRARRPDASLTGQYLFTPDAAGFSSNQRSWNIAAQLTIPIYQGRIVSAQVEEARAEVEAAQSTLQQVRQSVALDVRSALLDLQEAARRRQTAAANVGQAREALRIAQVRFQAGVSTSVEVTDAQFAYIQAQTNQVNAEFDYLSAEARLRRAVGRLVPEATREQVQSRPGPPPPTTVSPAASPANGPTIDNRNGNTSAPKENPSPSTEDGSAPATAPDATPGQEEQN